MHDGTPTSLLRDGVVLLGFGLVFVLLFRRIGLGATLGYLVAGAVVGPHVLGLVGDAEAKLGFAELGITLLLFIVGLELNPSRLWRMKHEIFGLGLMQVVACGLAITAIVWLGARFSLPAALALGLPLALSSTAQVLPMLQSSGRMRTPFGERAFSILLFQDLSIVPLITIVAAMSRNPADANAPPGWLLALYTVAAVVGLIIAGRFLLRPFFRLIGNMGEREMFVFAGLFTVIASAAVMEWLGLSTALGAFIAGVMLADSPYRHELEADVEPFRSILLGLFFLAVGMLLDLGAIAERPLFVLAMAAALIATKTGVIMAIGMAFKMTWRQAFALGLLLSQGGEFGFVLFAQAQAGLLIDPEAASLFGAIITLSMATTPFLMGITRRFRTEPIAPGTDREGPVADGANAIIVGYGRFGQTVGQMLLAQGIPVTLIDTDIEMIDIAGEFGAKVYYGDGTRLDLLRQAGAADAELICMCIDGDQIEPETIAAIHEAFPKAEIYVRAFDRRTLVKLKNGPATYVVREVLESAVKMARLALRGLGVAPAEIDRAEEAYRARDKERLRIQIAAGDIRAARTETAQRFPWGNDPQ
ncbi:MULTISPECIES: cation:proton antiporter [Sphingomonas]|jgi:monovalent cation:proton antiporter-2 (CPA2) family protein|uniref:cation:proton antiporter domain-containing protein n=1 Tax=Sphingomonas TaxID=13687 RepID=UPI0004DF5E10|nr:MULTISPECIES: cation:proton antiporter [Sphingomonas]KQM94844.1 sodium:proton exchanger [Sphingomonas sp. Leaf226]MBB3587283.1 CPA2 family monovalent cation:H+ antiporter-2/glutathione-regulated potassium-efflux system protein KefB [Sphingomonas sp. BK481]MBD8470527.1 cation:proton antiporter [Sphingomonas sp. CFBP 8765]MBD8640706.1 cation:proton antiporter [Sphingomonas sp. CFBP 13733]MBD8734605.1 cation:proton antiporter [Sphingomonas sp. CFBP 13706]